MEHWEHFYIFRSWFAGKSRALSRVKLVTPLQRSSTLSCWRITVENPLSLFSDKGCCFSQRETETQPQMLWDLEVSWLYIPACAAAEPHCEWYKDVRAVCVCVCVCKRESGHVRVIYRITETKEESRRHQMNGVFLFLLLKRKTDGPTEHEARWTFVNLRWWHCMLEERRWEDLVEVNQRSKFSKQIQLALVEAGKFQYEAELNK